MVAGGLGGGGTAGGSGGYSNVLSSVEIFDPATISWTRASDMGVARYAHTATTLPNGSVLVAGGISATGYVRAAELFDPARGDWRPAGIPNDGRGTHTATLLADGRVLVAGGGPTFSEPGIDLPPSATAEIYDPSNESWTDVPLLNTARTFATATLLDGPQCREGNSAPYCGGVLVVGGGGTTTPDYHQGRPIALGSAEIYQPRSRPGSANAGR
jgi:hypothetical protein